MWWPALVWRFAHATMAVMEPIAQPQSIVQLEPDPDAAAWLATCIKTEGGRAIAVTTPDQLVAAVDRWLPVLILIDVDSSGDWPRAIQRCKNRPHTQHIPIYAFSCQDNAPLLEQARAAGVDHAWLEDEMKESLIDLVKRYLYPPVEYLPGWDDALSDRARTGLLEFNRGEFFAQHEHLEAAWMAEPRPIRVLYQGILQVGLAFLQIQRGNWRGALKMFRRGLPRLRNLPPVCQGIRLAEFRAAAEAIHAEISELGPERLAEFDQRRFPTIRFA
jgi:predicted metal-dependent hydrolase